MQLYYVFYFIDLLAYYTIHLTGYPGLYALTIESFSVSLNEMMGFKKKIISHTYLNYIGYFSQRIVLQKYTVYYVKCNFSVA